MLVLSRKKNESIVINNDITIVVVEIRGDKVRLGVEAPKKFRCIGARSTKRSIGTPPEAPREVLPCRTRQRKPMPQPATLEARRSRPLAAALACQRPPSSCPRDSSRYSAIGCCRAAGLYVLPSPRWHLRFARYLTNGRKLPVYPVDSIAGRPRRLAWSRTQAFHACNTGSNPVGVIFVSIARVIC